MSCFHGQYISVLVVFLSVNPGKCDLFTSTDKLRDLASVEKKLLPQINDVVTELQDKIKALRSILADIKESHSNDDDLVLAGHPVQAYNLIKRWRHMQHLFIKTRQRTDEKGDSKEIPLLQNCDNSHHNCSMWAKRGECTSNPSFMLQQCKLSCKVCGRPKAAELDGPIMINLRGAVYKTIKTPPPSKGDYEGSAQGLIRLQRTYNIDTENISAGNIYGYRAMDGLQPDDFFHLGKQAVCMQEWGYGLQWLKKAHMSQDRTVTDRDITVYIAKAYLGIEDYLKAREYVKLGYGDYDPDIYTSYNLCFDDNQNCPAWAQRAECINNHKYMHLHCSYSCNVCKKRGPERFPGEYELSNVNHALRMKVKRTGYKNLKQSFTAEPNTVRTPQPSWKPVYESLCRGQGVKWYNNAVCRYRISAGIPWNVYKEEILKMNPRIALIYDVISEEEADTLVDKAKKKMYRALVGSDRRHSNDRVSNVGWLGDWDPFIKSMSERVEQITGLEVTLRINNPSGARLHTSSDEFQAVNYGIGGHYEPHVDYFKGDKGLENTEVGEIVRKSGDRIATFLLYLTDVKAGGGTVYPKVKIQVPPVKRAAAFWFNSQLSGKYDPLTMHAGCPVLLGEKWVCNKWIREFGNEFNRKCHLRKDAVYS